MHFDQTTYFADRVWTAARELASLVRPRHRSDTQSGREVFVLHPFVCLRRLGRTANALPCAHLVRTGTAHAAFAEEDKAALRPVGHLSMAALLLFSGFVDLENRKPRRHAHQLPEQSEAL